jgi:acyl carrier protein phosphodiesterase
VNFLAHLWLADGAQAAPAGAILGDVLRGALPGDMDPELARSVRLHRRIDADTDRHPRVQAARRRFGPGARRYSGILLDLLYDHALARQWPQFSGEPLPEFAERMAQAVEREARWFTPGMAPRAGPFTALLLSYATVEGFELAVQRTARRLRQPQGLLDAMKDWRQQLAPASADLPVLLEDLVRTARDFMYATPSPTIAR